MDQGGWTSEWNLFFLPDSHSSSWGALTDIATICFLEEVVPIDIAHRTDWHT